RSRLPPIAFGVVEAQHNHCLGRKHRPRRRDVGPQLLCRRIGFGLNKPSIFNPMPVAEPVSTKKLSQRVSFYLCKVLGGKEEFAHYWPLLFSATGGSFGNSTLSIIPATLSPFALCSIAIFVTLYFSDR